ncbi:uncharacterized protein LOC143861631 [Tasmannia lanceolata]|uniref:uncharacterized protein LOC143861631 n=1 Tax=Tasmannia lanceolata TaxID=3420 RepID=UPI0040630B46
MENPFYRKAYRPRYSPILRQIPVRNQTKPKPSPSPKVISIPVHFVSSEKTRSDATVKIQKVFRGFMVRKNVKKIFTIQREVDKIEQRLSQGEMEDLLWRDAKERLRVNEMLMALLFRLDSVCGVDSGVRDCRKGVIRRVIALQERIDGIVAGKSVDLEADDSNSSGNFEIIADETVNRGLEVRNPVESAETQTLEIQNAENGETLSDDAVNQTLEIQNPLESADSGEILSDDAVNQTLEIQNPLESAENGEILSDGAVYQVPEIQNPREELSDAIDQTLQMPDTEKVDIDAEPVEETTEDCELALYRSEQEKEERVMMSDSMESVEEEKEGQEKKEEKVIEGSEENGGKKGWDLVERMMEENEKLKGLVLELCERNALQCRMINSLTQRVGQMERRMKGRKKKRLEINSNARKCGRKL